MKHCTIHDVSYQGKACPDCARYRARITNRALSVLRDRHPDEYRQIRDTIKREKGIEQ